MRNGSETETLKQQEKGCFRQHQLSTFSPLFSILRNLSNHWWRNCKNATKTYTQHTKWLTAFWGNLRTTEMALILNSSIGMIFLKDVGIEPGLPYLANRPNVENNGSTLYYKRTLAIPFLDGINFLLSECSKTKIMWRHLFFYHLKHFLRVALRKQLNPLTYTHTHTPTHTHTHTPTHTHTKYQSVMTNNGCHFHWWYNFWKDRVKHQQDQPDSIIKTLQFADLDQAYSVCCK